MADLLVVGAGSAGAVIAGRAAVRHRRRVTLVDAGPLHCSADTPAAIAGPNFHRALEEPGRTWTGHLSGRGAGGSSAVNAMVASAVPAGEPSDATVLLPRRVAAPHERGPLTEAMVAGARSDGLEVHDALLTRDADGRRCSVNDAYLEPARGTGRLEEVGDAIVDRVLWHGRRAVGVGLADGRELEAGRVVVSAGALRSPAVLLRSGLDRPGIGSGLQDHPSLTVEVRLRDEAVVGWRDRVGAIVSVTALVRASHRLPGDLQLLAADAVDPVDPTVASVVVTLMSVASRGSVRLGGTSPHDEPQVEFDPDGHPADRDGMAAGRALLERVLSTDEVRAVLASRGEPVVGGAYHTSSTCRMGRPDDPRAVVDHECRVIGTDSLWVCDASVFPRVPLANPHLPVVLLAERMAAIICS